MTTSAAPGHEPFGHDATAETSAPSAEDFGAVLADAEAVLSDVERALQRIGAGTYTTCEICGGSIDAGRLERVPTARTCGSHGADDSSAISWPA